MAISEVALQKEGKMLARDVDFWFTETKI